MSRPGKLYLDFAPVPMTQSPRLAPARIFGLHVANVQNPWNGFGAKPKSRATMYE